MQSERLDFREALERAPERCSVHAVHELGGEAACGSVDATSLQRLTKAWEHWLPYYRCEDCHRLVEGPS